MTRALDSSVILASLYQGEPHHAACSALLEQGGHRVYLHALAEVFSVLTGGSQRPRIGAEVAVRLLRESVLPYVKTVSLTERELMAALDETRGRGVRGGAVYDWLHLVAARKAEAEALVTLDRRHFEALAQPGDPRIEEP